MQNSELKLHKKEKTLKAQAKPFVKWAGGKTQLLCELAHRLPLKIKISKIIDRYVEPFVGGGAFFFYLKGNYQVKEAFLYDINVELIVGYKTCFNGLFRQNKKGKFNVPFGRYKNPTICDKENLLKVHEALKCTHIFAADFEESKNFITKDTLVYFDPPYRPLNNTSNFTSYDKDGFTDEDQIRLSDFYKEMDKKGAFLLLSNSDPKNVDINDDFFDSLYADYKIERVNAKRFINCDGAKRGDITELLIRNYE